MGSQEKSAGWGFKCMAIDLDKNHPARGKMPVRKIASRLVPLVLQGVGQNYLTYKTASMSIPCGGYMTSDNSQCWS